jgi:cell division protein FtsB
MVKVDLGIWNKLTWAVIFLGFLAGIALVAGSYLPLINQNERMRRKIDDLSSLIQREEDTERNLRASIDALQHDPRTVERMAREILLYDKPGETVIRYSEPDSNSPPDAGSTH